MTKASINIQAKFLCGLGYLTKLAILLKLSGSSSLCRRTPYLYKTIFPLLSLSWVEHLLLIALLRISVGMLRLLRLLSLLSIHHTLRVLCSWLDWCRFFLCACSVYALPLLHILDLVLVLDGHTAGAAVCRSEVRACGATDTEPSTNFSSLITELQTRVNATGRTP